VLTTWQLAQADWFMLHLQPMSLLLTIHKSRSSKTLHLPQLHLYRSAIGNWCYLCSSRMSNILTAAYLFMHCSNYVQQKQ